MRGSLKFARTGCGWSNGSIGHEYVTALFCQGILRLLGGLVDRLLGLACSPVDLALALQVAVVGQRAHCFLGAALRFICLRHDFSFGSLVLPLFPRSARLK